MNDVRIKKLQLMVDNYCWQDNMKDNIQIKHCMFYAVSVEDIRMLRTFLCCSNSERVEKLA